MTCTLLRYYVRTSKKAKKSPRLRNRPGGRHRPTSLPWKSGPRPHHRRPPTHRSRCQHTNPTSSTEVMKNSTEVMQKLDKPHFPNAVCAQVISQG